MRYIFSLILIVASIGTFVLVINPRYKDIKQMRSDIKSFDARFATAQKLKVGREELISRYNSISKTDLDNIKALLPDSVDNIRLIIQLDALATKNGLSSLRGVSYEALKSEQNLKPVQGVPVKPYGEFVLSFETTGGYKNFLSFISDLEQNLRLVDVTEVQFSGTTDKNVYDSLKYKVTLKTYWLKK